MREYVRRSMGDPDMVGSSEARAAWHHISPIHVDDLADMKRAFFQLTALEPDALLRTCTPGHLTASAVVFSHDVTETILMHHTKLQRWLQPGGHADGEANLARVALKEASEETGIEGLEIIDPAVDLDIHNVAPAGQPEVLHYDVRFAAMAPEGAQPHGNHESTDIRWVRLPELDQYELDDGTLRMIEAARVAATQISTSTSDNA